MIGIASAVVAAAAASMLGIAPAVIEEMVVVAAAAALVVGIAPAKVEELWQLLYQW